MQGNEIIIITFIAYFIIINRTKYHLNYKKDYNWSENGLQNLGMFCINSSRPSFLLVTIEVLCYKLVSVLSLFLSNDNNVRTYPHKTFKKREASDSRSTQKIFTMIIQGPYFSS